MSRSQALRLAGITGFLWTCLSLPVRADPVVLTSGSLEYQAIGSGGPINLFGTDGFSLIGFIFSGAFEPDMTLRPGAVTRLSGALLGSSTGGVVTYLGQTFTSIGSIASNNTANFSFSSGTFTLPTAPSVPLTITYSVPFTLAGRFFGTPGDGINEIPTVFFDFFGSGIGRVSFTFFLGAEFPGGGFWNTGNPVRLDIANTAVPEPGTLVLLGLGLAGAYGQRYRRSRREQKAARAA